VQLIVYEIHMAMLLDSDIVPALPNEEPLATARQMQNFYQHLEQTLVTIAFLDPHLKRQMMLRLQRLFNRACLEERELNILRGILTAVQRKIGDL
jgi:tRNA C32,U32 (ribose-2'-O)-methylase TrmJ